MIAKITIWFDVKSSRSNNRSTTEGILCINLSMQTNYSAVMDMSFDPVSIMALCFAFKTLEIAAFISISTKQLYMAAVAASIWLLESIQKHTHTLTHEHFVLSLPSLTGVIHHTSCLSGPPYALCWH